MTLPSPPPSPGSPLLGAWARSGTFTGLVAAVDGDEVALFDPAARQLTRVPAAEVEAVPAGAVTVTVTAEVPLAHGLAEDDLRRWIASLLDGVVRDRAAEALAESGLDAGPALPTARVEVRPSPGSGAVCLAGHRTPAAGEVLVRCAACGRAAVPPPRRNDGFG